MATKTKQNKDPQTLILVFWQKPEVRDVNDTNSSVKRGGGSIMAWAASATGLLIFSDFVLHTLLVSMGNRCWKATGIWWCYCRVTVFCQRAPQHMDRRNQKSDGSCITALPNDTASHNITYGVNRRIRFITSRCNIPKQLLIFHCILIFFILSPNVFSVYKKVLLETGLCVYFYFYFVIFTIVML